MDFLITIGEFISRYIASVPAFLLGMLTGAVAVTSMLTFFFIRGKNIDLDEIRKPTIEVDEDILVEIIKEKQNRFKKYYKSNPEGVGKLTFNLSFELVEEIARYFFPESKYPTMELSINELLNLNHYITKRVDDLLDKPVIKNTKNMQVIRIMQFLDKKKLVEETKLVRAAKKLQLPKVLKYGGAVFNAMNPVYWFRKLVISTSINAMTKKVCLVMIGIVGEETIKVYSKALFEQPLNIEFVEKQLEELLTEDMNEDEEN